jgi:hypothetical protein
MHNHKNHINHETHHLNKLLKKILLGDLKKTIPYNKPIYLVPKINPTKPIVGGTVESHKKPNAIPNPTAMIGLGGRKINIAITKPLAK